MNKKLFVLAAFSALVLTGCPNNPAPTPEPEPAVVVVGGVTLDKTALNLKVDETAKLTATVLPEDATDKTVTWSSADTSVATVDAEGNVTAVGAGSTFVTVASVSDPTKTAKCRVNVSGVNKLIEAFAGLGDKVEAVAVLSAGQKDAAGKTVEEAVSFTVDMTPKYNVIEGISGYAFIGDETNGKYYGVYKTADGFENVWGVAYDTAEEFAAKESLKSFGDFLTNTTDEVVESAGTFKYAGEVKTELARRLGVNQVTASTIGAVKLSVNEAGIVVDFLYQPTSPTPVISYTVATKADLAYGELEAFLLTATPKASPVSAKEILTENFVDHHNYTFKYGVVAEGGVVCYQSEYSTDDTYSIAWDEGWAEAGYASYRQVTTYAYVPKNYTLPEGLYTVEDLTTADPAVMAAHAKAGYTDPKEGSIEYDEEGEAGFWYDAEEYNPVRAATAKQSDVITEEITKEYTLDSLFIKERFDRDNGQYFQMKAGDVIETVEYETVDESGATVTAKYDVKIDSYSLFLFAYCYRLISYWDMDYKTGMEEIDLFVEYKDETEAANNVDTLGFYYEMLAVHAFDGEGVAPYEAYDYAEYINFGTTVDPYAGVIIGNIAEPFDITWYVNGEVAEDITMNVGDKVDLTYVVDPAFSGQLSILDETVVAFEDGQLVAKAPGSTKVAFVETNGIIVYFPVTVAHPAVGTWNTVDGEGTAGVITIAEDLTFTFGGVARQLVEQSTGVYTFEYEGASDGVATVYFNKTVCYIKYTTVKDEETVNNYVDLFTDDQFASVNQAYNYANQFATGVAANYSFYLAYAGDGIYEYVGLYFASPLETSAAWTEFFDAKVAAAGLTGCDHTTAIGFKSYTNAAEGTFYLTDASGNQYAAYFLVCDGALFQIGGYTIIQIQVVPLF